MEDSTPQGQPPRNPSEPAPPQFPPPPPSGATGPAPPTPPPSPSSPAAPATGGPTTPPSDNPFAAPQTYSQVSIDSSEGAPLASRVSRFVAVLIDNIIGGLVFAVAMIPFGLWSALEAINGSEDEIDAFLGLGIGFFFAMGAYLIYAAVQAYLLSTRGQSIGKILMKVRIVQVDGSPVGFFHAVFLRYIVFTLGVTAVAGVMIFVLGDLGSFLANSLNTIDALFIFRDDRRCIHDLIASTKVVKV